MAAEKKRNLGRGLSALLGEDSEDYARLDRLRVSKMVPIELVHPGRFQPRHGTDEESIKELAQSIGEKGILQPILVRRQSDEPNAFEIIAGERRWRAAQIAKLHEVPVIIKDLTDAEALEVALVENLQRQDLSPLEEAEGYQRLIDEFSHTQEKLSRVVGKSRSHVANMMRLLALPDPVKTFLDVGTLSAGHARALLMADDPAALAGVVVSKGLNVRQTEGLVRRAKEPAKAKPPLRTKDTDTLALERDLENLLGLRVDIRFRNGGGTLSVHYSSLEQLDEILQRLSHGGRTVAPEISPGPRADLADAPTRTKAEPGKRPQMSVRARAGPRSAVPASSPRTESPGAAARAKAPSPPVSKSESPAAAATGSKEAAEDPPRLAVKLKPAKGKRSSGGGAGEDPADAKPAAGKAMARGGTSRPDRSAADPPVAKARPGGKDGSPSGGSAPLAAAGPTDRGAGPGGESGALTGPAGERQPRKRSPPPTSSPARPSADPDRRRAAEQADALLNFSSAGKSPAADWVSESAGGKSNGN